MFISLRQIYAKLDQSCIEEFYATEAPGCFSSVVMLEALPPDFSPGTVYFVRASLLAEYLPENDVAFVIFNDCRHDFSKYSTERIILNSEEDFYRVYAAVIETIEKTAAESYAVETMLNNLFENKSIKEVLDLSSDFLRNPLVAFLVVGKETMLLHSYIKDAEENLSVPDYSNFSAQNMARLSMHDADSIRMMSINSPIMFSAGANFADERRLCILIRDKTGDAKGGLVLYERESVFSERDFAYLYIVSTIVGEKAKLLNKRGIVGISNEQRIIDLLRDEVDSTDDSWLNSIDGHKHKNFYCIVLDLSSTPMFERAKYETILRFKQKNHITVKYGSYILIIINVRTSENVKELLSVIDSAVKGSKITVGISEQFSDIKHLKKYYEQAKKAISINIPGISRQIRHYDSIKYYALLSELPRNTNLEAYIRESYLKLKRYDTEKNSEYIKTLVALIFNGNRKDVCSELHIHRNTLPQRLEKIEKITGHTVSDNEFLFDMFFSYMIDIFLENE